MSDIPEWANKRIKKAKDTQSKELDLTFDVMLPDTERLEEIPNSVFELKYIELLNLAGNAISYIPDQIEKLANLKTLRLPSNNITRVANNLANISGLSHLDLDNNPLNILPPVFFKLRNLKVLSMDDNFLEEIPESISELHKLTILSFERNLISEIPDAVYSLIFLERLSLANTTNLYGYTPHQNQNRNKITAISSKILQLLNLKELNLDGNVIESPTSEIVNIKGRGFADLARLRSYFQNLESEGIDHLYEAKLLILGEGGAGKTTLARKILDSSYRLDEHEETTKGIDIIQWHFLMENGTLFKANIWDFGGQEIYHATHRYFLTNRSLYLLVVDTRKDDTDFYYWLNIIELLSGNSPLLIIKNEKQDRHREIPESQFRSQFSNLKGTITTNLATNRGLDEVHDEIKHYIKRLPHIGNPLPKSWVKVRLELEKDERDYIELDEFLSICERNGFRSLEDKLQLSGYLHDLGVFLHFQNDDLLRKIIILKPRWGTEAAYLVLDNLKIIRNSGVFTRQDLKEIWNTPEYTGMIGELLQLMVNFKLCYQIPTNSGIYVAPQLLPEEHAEYEWNENENILLRYTYEFMPKGILSQFIVVMNSHIVGQKLVWRNGVVLEKLVNAESRDDNTRVEVVEDYNRRELRIRISGKYIQEALSIITYELDNIHKSYKRLKFKKLIPCSCSVCSNNQEPNFYSLDMVRRFASDQQLIQCQVSYRMVNASQLLEYISWSGVTKVESEDSYFHKPEGFGAKVTNIYVGGNFDGNLTVGDDNKILKDSYNKITSARIDTELKETLKQLADAVLKMNSFLSEVEATEVTENFALLINQATKEKPNKQWYSVSIDGLIKAAENVEKVGEPVINLSRKILSLLSGGVIK